MWLALRGAAGEEILCLNWPKKAEGLAVYLPDEQFTNGAILSIVSSAVPIDETSLGWKSLTDDMKSLILRRCWQSLYFQAACLSMSHVGYSRRQSKSQRQGCFYWLCKVLLYNNDKTTHSLASLQMFSNQEDFFMLLLMLCVELLLYLWFRRDPLTLLLNTVVECSSKLLKIDHRLDYTTIEKTTN